MKSLDDCLIVALDTSSKDEALKTVDKLSPYVEYFKVGLELFSSVGPQIICEIKNRGKKIFFDGKFFDITNTVNNAISNIVKLDINMINVHILGSGKMIKEAKQTLLDTAKNNNLIPPVLLGVTILTSINEETLNTDLKIPSKIQDYILHLTKLGIDNGLDGVVCSPQEAKIISEEAKRNNKNDFAIVTPGVRPSWASVNDQKRIATPKDAILNGATHIVVGRPITCANNPIDAVKKVFEEIEEVKNIIRL